MEHINLKKVSIACLGFLIFVALMAYGLKSMEPQTTAVSNEQDKVLYLTFDDGPSKQTEKVLAILDEYEVKATFFVTGTSEEHLSLIKEEAVRGHAIGIHTYSHDYKQIYSSVEAYIADMDKINAVIQEQTGSYSTIFRFPGGASNTVSRKYQNGIMTELTSQLSEKGYSYYDWNAENGDGNSHLSADTLLQTALSSVKGKQHVMMLMHDGGGNSATVEALPGILKALKAQGYQFKTIDSETPVFHHHVAN